MVKESPLEVLAYKLRRLYPPSILSLIEILGSAEAFRDFVAIVREFLPEHEGEILPAGSPSEQMASFARYFEARYFPLAWHIRDEEAEDYCELTDCIPVTFLGLSYDDYNDMLSQGNLGYQLLIYLFETVGDNIREVTEGIVEHVPQEVLNQVPKFADDEESYWIFQTDGPYPGIAWWLRITRADTGNVFYDICDEDYWHRNVQTFFWIRDEVDELTLQWQRADQIDTLVFEMTKWLEEKPKEHFQEVINYIRKRLDERRKIFKGV